jgi:hypothetical protein
MVGQLLGTANTIMYVSFGIAALGILFALVVVGRLFRSGAQNRRLLQAGESAAAVILELRDTGVTVNGNPQVELVLDVLPPNRSPFRATARTMISRLQTSQVQPGMQVLVKYDPNDLSKVALAGFMNTVAP